MKNQLRNAYPSLLIKNQWKTRLSDHGQRNLQQLIDHEQLTAVFDDLLDIPGLLNKISDEVSRLLISTSWLAHAMGQEVLRFLEHIKEV
jgi:hypothetical protein